MGSRRHLEVIGLRIGQLLDAIEACADVPEQALDERGRLARLAYRHPYAYAVAMLGVGLFGGRMIARDRAQTVQVATRAPAPKPQPAASRPTEPSWTIDTDSIFVH